MVMVFERIMQNTLFAFLTFYEANCGGGVAWLRDRRGDGRGGGRGGGVARLRDGRGDSVARLHDGRGGDKSFLVRFFLNFCPSTIIPTFPALFLKISTL